MGFKAFEGMLAEELSSRGVSEGLITDVIDSGYMAMPFGGHFSGKTELLVLDKMFGNKGISSCFNVDEFVRYLLGEYKFPKQPEHREYVVKNIDDINGVLNDERRQRYIKNGILSFRGQTSQYTYKRKVPSPVRANSSGQEISLFPGLYRQGGEFYSFKETPKEERTLQYFLRELEPNNPDVYLDSAHAYDIMRTEQHYATQTAGLDISFDIETAIFFATYKFKTNSCGRAYYEKIEKGNHDGVIYGFCFRDPPVKKTEFLITDFDFFKTYKPERILRQNCGLPLFSEYDRNIAVTDLDFIIRLHEDFEYDGERTPDFMFPNAGDDKFYGKLLELKDRHPEWLSRIVEYEGSRAFY